MQAWKVLLICALACIFFGLVMATIAIPLASAGSERWLWLAGLLAATTVVGLLLAAFLRYAGGALDAKSGGRHF